jgi:hypothetical protein
VLLLVSLLRLLLAPRLLLELLSSLLVSPLLLAWPPPFLLELLLGFFWLLPSSSLLNEHMGNCAIDRTAYIGGLLLLLQVFFEDFHSEASEKCSYFLHWRPPGLPGAENDKKSRPRKGSASRPFIAPQHRSND